MPDLWRAARDHDGGPWGPGLALALTHQTGPHGQLAPEWGPGPEQWAMVPGGSKGEQVLLIRDWDAVVHTLRQRNLRAISQAHALAGVTLQHEDGLLIWSQAWTQTSARR